MRHFAALSGWQGADWHYLSAPRAVLAPIWEAYWVWVDPPTKAGKDPEYEGGLYLIDPTTASSENPGLGVVRQPPSG